MNRTRIRAEVFSREDIQNVLRAIDKANLDLAENLPIDQVRVYRAGFMAALEAMSQAFDISIKRND